MEKNKYTLYTIIILLIIFLPCSIYGTYMHIKNTANLKHDFKFNNKLYFYENDKLLGTYECKSEICDYAVFSNNDIKSSIINGTHAFIEDNKKIYLYDIKSQTILQEYEEVQNASEFIYSVRQGGLWGALNITNTVSNLLYCKYDNIETKNNKLVALKDGKWTIFQGQNELFVSDLKIKDLNDNFIIVSDGSYDKIYDYQKKEYIDTTLNKTISFANEFALVKRENYYSVYQFNKIAEDYVPAIIGSFYYNGEAEITYQLGEENIEFYAGESLLKSIELTASENY